jgi:ketosteroid isomerase-like protein
LEVDAWPIAAACRTLVDLAQRYNERYAARDIDGIMALFADDAELTWAGGTFRGKAKVRKVVEWDVEQSPTARVDLTGIGIVTGDRLVVAERVVHLTADGIAYEEPALTVFEVDDDGLIVRMRSYYDKLGLMHQIASKYPGVKGRLFRAMTGFLVKMGSQGLQVSPD